MQEYTQTLIPYAYNILGSIEEARDVVQDVLENHINTRKRDIENVVGYLVKSVINKSINIKKRQQRLVTTPIWLPEPIATENADSNLRREELISYSMLVLLEKLTPKERAVFILKLAFDYSHEDVANVLDCSTENARKLLSRAKNKLAMTQENTIRPFVHSKEYLQKYIQIIRDGDIAALEQLLAEDITVTADGGTKIKVVRELTVGRKNAIDILLLVYHAFQRSQEIKIMELNHQPALLFYQNDILSSCQVFEVDANGIVEHIYAIVDPEKLKVI